MQGDETSKHHVWMIEAARTPSGRLFPQIAEAEVQRSLPGLARRAIGSVVRGEGRLIAALENFSAPIGAPDLLCAWIDPAAYERRVAAAVPPLLNELDASIVALLSARYRCDLDELVARVQQPRQTVQRRLRELRRVGAVTQSDNAILRAPGLSPVGTFWAFEAKVSDWSRGLQQARRYALWADYSVLVLPRAPRDPDATRSRAARMEIGVFANEQWVSRPSRVGHSAARRLWASDHFFAAATPVS